MTQKALRHPNVSPTMDLIAKKGGKTEISNTLCLISLSHPRKDD